MKVGKLVLFRKRVASHTPLGTKHVCAVLRSGGGVSASVLSLILMVLLRVVP